MASVYQTKDRNGKPHKVWRFRFKDHTGKYIYGTGWPEKKKTLEHARSIEAEHRAVSKGEKAAPPSWLKNRNKPIAEVIDGYLAWGRAQGGRYGRPWDEQNARLKERALSWWCEELGLTVLADVDLPRVEKVLQTLLLTKTPKTVALKVESLRALCCWAVKRGLLPDNPLRGMAKLDTRPKEPHRELTDQEVAGLLNAAAPERRIWYETGLQTGFRLNELRRLRVKDIDPFTPSLFLAADFSKDRKDHRQHITRELADKLTNLAKGKTPEERLLGIPCGPDPAAYIAADYTQGGVVILTPEGKATWHSLRKVFINSVVRSGADLKTIMEMARHSTATMSMDVYAKPKPDLLRHAAEAAAQRIKGVLEETDCGTGVERGISKNTPAAVSTSQQRDKVGLKMVGDTGLEPVTLSLSS
jgi:integrase